MLTETVRAFDGMDIETADSQGAANTIWVDSQYWPAARDRNVCIVTDPRRREGADIARGYVLAHGSAQTVTPPVAAPSRACTRPG